MVAAALLSNRDGIVGAPLETHPPLPRNLPDDVAGLDRMAPVVRDSILLFDLASRVSFSLNAEGSHGPTVELWRWVEPGKASPRTERAPLVKLSAPSIPQFEKQMQYLAAYADLRQDRTAEILSQTTTLVPFFGSLLYMDPGRTPHTLEFLSVALHFTNMAYMRVKFGLGCKRPVQFSPQVQPMIPTPTHPTLPSGHATEAFLLGRLLWKLLRDSHSPQSKVTHGSWGEMLMRQAARIAVNRTVAGVHFPVDSVAGAVLGLTLADFIHQLCRTDACVPNHATFVGENFDPGDDFDWHPLYEVEHDRQTPSAGKPSHPWATSEPGDSKFPTAPSPALRWLWEKALDEWREPVR